MQSSYIVFFCLIAVALAAPPKFEQVHDKCQSDPATSIDDSTAEKLKRGEKVDDPKLGPHELCMNVGRGIQKENGDVDVDGLKKDLENVPEDARNKAVAACGQRAAGSTAAEAAIALTTCLRDSLGHGHSHGHGHGHGGHGHH